jgi:UDP-N-acetylglucosamine acyltransferase
MIHKTAVVDPAARIGRDVTVGPFAVIEEDVVIGDGCSIGPHACILRYTSLGNNCEVHAGAVLGDLPQDVDFEPCESRLRIGSNCLIREGVTLHRGTRPGSATEIGDGCFLMAFSHCAHNVRLGNRVVLANGCLLGGYARVDDGAFISGNCLVHQFVRVGRLVIMGGGSGVSKDVPPFCMVRPITVNTVIGLNVVGLRRAGLKPAERKEIKAAFDILYRSGLTVSEAVERLGREFAGGPPLEIRDFARDSERGICGLGGDAQANAASR